MADELKPGDVVIYEGGEYCVMGGDGEPWLDPIPADPQEQEVVHIHADVAFDSDGWAVDIRLRDQAGVRPLTVPRHGTFCECRLAINPATGEVVGQGDQPWECAGCGGEYDAGVKSCPNCDQPADDTAAKVEQACRKMYGFLCDWRYVLAGNQMTEYDFNHESGVPEAAAALAAAEREGVSNP